MNLEIKAGKYLVVSEWEIEAGKEQDIKAVWDESSFKNLLGDYVLYKGIIKNTYVLMYEITDFGKLQQLLESDDYRKLLNDLSAFVASDIHQGLYGLVDSVKDRETFIPVTKYMQLRSIEVPLSGIDPYLDWRKRRIYKYVDKNDKVKSFLSFHSVFSTEPGVLFVTEFEGDPDEYRNSFLTDEYKQIIKEAGHDHIKGGLNTFEYVLVDRK